jgi:hypothetical protein
MLSNKPFFRHMDVQSLIARIPVDKLRDMLAFDAHCRQIPNSQLTLADIPSDGASAERLREFALSFNGYDYWGSDEVYTKVAHAGLHGNLTEMRTWLFFQQRASRYSDSELTLDDPGIRETLGRMREFVSRGRLY